MTSLRRSPRSLRAATVATLLLAPVLVAATGEAAAAAVAAPAPRPTPRARDLDTELAQARIARDAAEDALDAARRVLAPGHLLDPMPARLMAGIGELQTQYAEMERQAAGYRATLGDQHPTLKGAEQVLAELRDQILDGARRAIATAQGDAVHARAAVASLERQARAAEATGSIASPPPAPGPAASPAMEPPGSTPAAEPSARQPAPRTPRAEAPAAPGASASTAIPAAARSIAAELPLVLLRHAGIAATAGLLAGLMAFGLLVGLGRPRGRRPTAPVPTRIEPSAPVETAATTVQAEPREPRSQDRPAPGPVPVLATLPLAADDDPTAVQTRLDRDLDGALARGAASVFATLAVAAGPEPQCRVRVAVMPAAGTLRAQADAAAFALAAAAALAERRAVLVDGHSDDGLGPALALAAVALVETEDRVRRLVRVTVGERALAVLAGDAEDGGKAGATSPARLPNLDGFDAIVIAREPGSADTSLADVVLLVAPRDAGAAELSAAAHGAAGGRLCGVLLVDARAAEPATTPRQPEAPAPRRRHGPEAATARLGLRRAVEPVRRRA